MTCFLDLQYNALLNNVLLMASRPMPPDIESVKMATVYLDQVFESVLDLSQESTRFCDVLPEFNTMPSVLLKMLKLSAYRLSDYRITAQIPNSLSPLFCSETQFEVGLSTTGLWRYGPTKTKGTIVLG